MGQSISPERNGCCKHERVDSVGDVHPPTKRLKISHDTQNFSNAVMDHSGFPARQETLENELVSLVDGVQSSNAWAVNSDEAEIGSCPPVGQFDFESQQDAEDGDDSDGDSEPCDQDTIPSTPQLIEVGDRWPADGAGRISPIIVSKGKMTPEYDRAATGGQGVAKVLQEIATHHSLQHRMKTTPPDKWCDEMFQPAVDEALLKLAPIVREALGEELDVSIVDDQPFRIGLIRQLGKLMKEADLGFLDEVAGGCPVPLGTAERSYLWPLRKDRGLKRFDPDHRQSILTENYKSMDCEELKDLIAAEMEAQVANKWVKVCSGMHVYFRKMTSGISGWLGNAFVSRFLEQCSPTVVRFCG